MKYDERTGLYLPDDYRHEPAPNFPPRLAVPQDAKHPYIHITTDGHSGDVKERPRCGCP